MELRPYNPVQEAAEKMSEVIPNASKKGGSVFWIVFGVFVVVGAGLYIAASIHNHIDEKNNKSEGSVSTGETDLQETD